MLDALLERSPLFSALNPRHREQVQGRFVRLALRASSEVVRQGEVVDGLYLVESGRVSEVIQDAAAASAQYVRSVGAGEQFGEAELFGSGLARGSFVTMEATVLHRLPKEIVRAVAQQSADFSFALARSIAAQAEGYAPIPWAPLSRWKFDPRLWGSLPAQLTGSLSLCPLELTSEVLTLAMEDPRDSTALDAVRRSFPGVGVRILAVSREDLMRFVAQGSQTSARRSSVPPRGGRTSALPPSVQVSFVGYDDLAARAGGGSANQPSAAVGLVDEIVGIGLASGASDVHIEHEREGVVVRYRIDGALRRHREIISAEHARSIASRLKLLARLDITETRKPQDGRISVRLPAGRLVDLRVSTVPAKFGEKVALRILDSEAAIRDLQTLFPVERASTLFSQLVSRRTGLVLVSGPTGAGKSTTLYSALHSLRRDDLNIMTVEDPIEFHLDGVTQVEVHPETGTTFARVLRALLRQDPNVILVGEMRDSETARIAVEASLTGHLVLSSVHTNGVIEAIARLMDMGVEPYAMANGLLGVTHQRLVQRICPDCARAFDYPERVVEYLVQQGVLPAGQTVGLLRGAGCERCGGSGFRGRIAVHGMLVVNDEMREAISGRGDLAALRRAAGSGPHLDLREYAGALLRAGYTVPSEIMPLLQVADEKAPEQG